MDDQNTGQASGMANAIVRRKFDGFNRIQEAVSSLENSRIFSRA